MGNKYAKGYEFSKETKLKRKGNKYAKGKPVMINDQYFKTIQEASSFMGVSRRVIISKIERQTEGYRFV